MEYLEKCNYCYVTPKIAADGSYVCDINHKTCKEAVDNMERIKRESCISKDDIKALIAELLKEKSN